MFVKFSYLRVRHEVERPDQPDPGSLEESLPRIFSIESDAKIPEREEVWRHLDQTFLLDVLFRIFRPTFDGRQNHSVFFLDFELFFVVWGGHNFSFGVL